MHASSLLSTWTKCNKWPGGKWVFSFLLGRMVPYTGSIHAKVVELAPGRCVVVLADRRKVRNHLKSIHAIAMVNLGEVSSGLAINCLIPQSHRGIVRHIEIDYLKKARGVLTAKTDMPAQAWLPEQDVWVSAVITDASGEAVANVKVLWRISEKRV